MFFFFFFCLSFKTVSHYITLIGLEILCEVAGSKTHRGRHLQAVQEASYTQQPARKRQPAHMSPVLQSGGSSLEASDKSLLVSSSGSGTPSATARHLQAVQEASYTPSSLWGGESQHSLHPELIRDTRILCLEPLFWLWEEVLHHLGSQNTERSDKAKLTGGSNTKWQQDQLTPEISRGQKANVGMLLTEIKALWQHLNPILQPQQVLDIPTHQKNKIWI